jgi:hypothetical protein
MQLHKDIGLNSSKPVRLSDLGMIAIGIVLKATNILHEALDSSTTLKRFSSMIIKP